MVGPAAKREGVAHLQAVMALSAEYPVCRQYAQTAVDANAQNVQHHCGFGGGRWQNNFNAHFQWCLNVGVDAPRNETDARNHQLAQCVHPSPQNYAHCNDGSCQCGNGSGDQLCASHGGNDPSIGCTQQP
ncbi:hypothetical protein SAMN05444581_13216 [Methylocapsa palsarum]|uniref:Uncharacterized protein n=1 Tax=Methylocapsa palsarum TaxID=1612308 RepID=A0A1I4CZR3_9HYPH|nr:hypothetical protein SAMN05444581_13216 [Methylocapsa palsarum]